MALFPMSGVLRGFPSAAYAMYASTKTLVRPCSSKKSLIYELETYLVPKILMVIHGLAPFKKRSTSALAWAEGVFWGGQTLGGAFACSSTFEPGP